MLRRNGSTNKNKVSDERREMNKNNILPFLMYLFGSKFKDN